MDDMKSNSDAPFYVTRVALCKRDGNIVNLSYNDAKCTECRDKLTLINHPNIEEVVLTAIVYGDKRKFVPGETFTMKVIFFTEDELIKKDNIVYASEGAVGMFDAELALPELSEDGYDQAVMACAKVRFETVAEHRIRNRYMPVNCVEDLDAAKKC